MTEPVRSEPAIPPGRPAPPSPTPPLRLLVLGSHYPPHALGGYELLCRDHVAWLRRRGHAVTVLTSTYGVRARRVQRETGPAGEQVVRALDLHWRDFEHARPTGASLWEGEWRQRRVVERLVRDTRPQAVLVWHMAALSKSLLGVLAQLGVPGVVVVGEPWPVWDVDTDHWLRLWSRSPSRRVSRALKPALRPLASRLVAPVGAGLDALVPAYASEHLRRVVEEGVPVWRGRGTVVPNGVDLDVLWRERPHDEPVASPLRLLLAGRVERRKGAHTAVEALAMLRRDRAAVLTIAGWRDEAYAAELRSTVGRHGLQDAVTWLDPVPREQVADLYRGHDVLLFPTIWEEPFGLVPLEAMATGCAVVATGTGGSAEYLRDGENCLLFPVEDAAAAAACVARVAADPALLARVRAGGGQTVRDHSFERYAAALEDLVRGIAAG